MKTVCVLQHVEAEYLGLMEDHLEGRGIRFRYFRPFTAGGGVPKSSFGFDGLIVLGAGPLGIVSGHLVPSLAPELRLAKDFIDKGLPVIGIGFGAILVAVAAGGGADEAPLRFNIDMAIRCPESSTKADFPERFAMVSYLRDSPVLPDEAVTLAEFEDGTPAVFTIGKKVLGFLGHPGMKSGIIEDLVIEFAESPDDTAQKLRELRRIQAEIAGTLSTIMRFIISWTGWMTDKRSDQD
ncbi:hypothetical protein [Hoeflea sp. TYP-13]|uniref:hypothetical protein n=1 Tax=Hoeflea sp. TYP-13 TaxID=3230023 RepID=UPI0034C631B5